MRIENRWNCVANECSTALPDYAQFFVYTLRNHQCLHFTPGDSSGSVHVFQGDAGASCDAIESFAAGGDKIVVDVGPTGTDTYIAVYPVKPSTIFNMKFGACDCFENPTVITDIPNNYQVGGTLSQFFPQGLDVNSCDGFPSTAQFFVYTATPNRQCLRFTPGGTSGTIYVFQGDAGAKCGDIGGCITSGAYTLGGVQISVDVGPADTDTYIAVTQDGLDMIEMYFDVCPPPPTCLDADNFAKVPDLPLGTQPGTESEYLYYPSTFPNGSDLSCSNNRLHSSTKNI